jgi:hypothetical protein
MLNVTNILNQLHKMYSFNLKNNFCRHKQVERSKLLDLNL